LSKNRRVSGPAGASSRIRSRPRAGTTAQAGPPQPGANTSRPRLPLSSATKHQTRGPNWAAGSVAPDTKPRPRCFIRHVAAPTPLVQRSCRRSHERSRNRARTGKAARSDALELRGRAGKGALWGWLFLFPAGKKRKQHFCVSQAYILLLLNGSEGERAAIPVPSSAKNQTLHSEMETEMGKP